MDGASAGTRTVAGSDAAVGAEAAVAPSEHAEGANGDDDADVLRHEVEALHVDPAAARASMAASESRVAATESHAAAAEAGDGETKRCATVAASSKANATQELAECKAREQQVQQQLEATAAAQEELKAKAEAEEAARGKTEEGEVTAVSRGRHFRDSTILARVAAGSVAGTAVDGLQVLMGWLPGPHYTPKGQTWTLIYRGSRDGWHPFQFRAACGGKGPTLVLVLGAARDDREFVAGGYATASWPSSPGELQRVADPESARSVGRGSFLFSLVDAAGHGPVQLPLKDPADGAALQLCPAGPRFGGGIGDLAAGGSCNHPLNHAGYSWTSTSRPSSSYDATAAAAQGCTTFRGPDHPQAKGMPPCAIFTTRELELFALQ